MSERKLVEVMNIQVKVLRIGITDNVQIYRDGECIGTSSFTELEREVFQDIVGCFEGEVVE